MNLVLLVVLRYNNTVLFIQLQVRCAFLSALKGLVSAANMNDKKYIIQTWNKSISIPLTMMLILINLIKNQHYLANKKNNKDYYGLFEETV